MAADRLATLPISAGVRAGGRQRAPRTSRCMSHWMGRALLSAGRHTPVAPLTRVRRSRLSDSNLVKAVTDELRKGSV